MNINNISSFYVKKTLINKKINNDLIEINESTFNDFYQIKINHIIYKRILKINKIFGLYKNEIDYINYLFENKTDENYILEDYLTEELTKEINNTIVKEIIKLSNQNDV